VNGVIPVFSFLIIPAVSAILISKNKIIVIVVACIISLLASFFGLNFSFHYDFPAGSSIVAVLGVVFVLASLYNILKSVSSKKKIIL
jgi:ABC-type Mn2+/Zn2+ transport system permease subunit